MTKREILAAPSVAYYSGFDGLEIKGIEWDIDTYILCVSGAWYGGAAARLPHRCKVYYSPRGAAYFKIYGRRVPLDDCIRMGA